MSEKMVKFVTFLGGLNLLEGTEKLEENVVFSDFFPKHHRYPSRRVQKKNPSAPCWADQGGLSSFLPLKKPSAPEVLQCFCECNDLDSLADDCIKSCCQGRMLEGAVGRKQLVKTKWSWMVYSYTLQVNEHNPWKSPFLLVNTIKMVGFPWLS